MATTRDRLLAEGMRLFGERGYSATSVAQIESAAGLSAGSGAMYKHFRSKEQLLSEGLDRLLAGRPQVTDPTGDDVASEPRAAQPSTAGRSATTAHQPMRDDVLIGKLTEVARLGLRRMAEDRDVNRLLFRGLDAFPALLERFGQGEIAALHRETTALLTQLAGSANGDTGEPVDAADWAAIAVVLQGAVAHYWLLADLFDGHPTGVDEGRFVAAVAGLAAALVAGPDRVTESTHDNHVEES